jgi:hypothetical protein
MLFKKFSLHFSRYRDPNEGIFYVDFPVSFCEFSGIFPSDIGDYGDTYFEILMFLDFQLETRGLFIKPSSPTHPKIDFYVYDSVKQHLYCVQVSITADEARHIGESLGYLDDDKKADWKRFLRTITVDISRASSYSGPETCVCPEHHNMRGLPENIRYTKQPQDPSLKTVKTKSRSRAGRPTSSRGRSVGLLDAQRTLMAEDIGTEDVHPAPKHPRVELTVDDLKFYFVYMGHGARMSSVYQLGCWDDIFVAPFRENGYIYSFFFYR